MIAYPLGVGGRTTRIVECGTGRPVIFVHGIGTRADRWSANLGALASNGVRAIALDLPGHGFASKGADFDYSVAGYARFLSEAIRALDVDRPVLVGASFGGQVVARLACDAPSSVAGLVLIGSLGFYAFGGELRAQMSRGLTDMSREAIAGRLRRGLYDQSLVTDDLIEEDWRINNSPGAAETFQAIEKYFASRIDDDLIADALASKGADIPKLLLWGEHDAAVSAERVRPIVEALPSTQFVVLSSAAHNPHMDQPEIVNAAMTSFVAKIARS